MLELTLLVLAGVLALFATFSAMYGIWTSVPYVPTPRPVLQKMIELADLQPGQTVYDCGAGDARLLIAAKRACPGIRVVGFETVPSVYLWGRIRIWFSRQKIEYHWSNALTHQYNDADCLFLYMSPKVMYALEEKFDRELKTGTKIISHAFRFSQARQPITECEVFSGRKRYIAVYEWSQTPTTR